MEAEKERGWRGPSPSSMTPWLTVVVSKQAACVTEDDSYYNLMTLALNHNKQYTNCRFYIVVSVPMI